MPGKFTKALASALLTVTLCSAFNLFTLGLLNPLAANGQTLIGSNIPINTALQDQSVPAVASNSVSGNFLVVWKSRPSLPSIKGRHVAGDGTLMGAEFSAVGTGSARNPAVSFDDNLSQFLVVSEDRFSICEPPCDPPVRMRGQLNKGDGSFGGQFSFAAAPMNSGLLFPAVAYNPLANQFLIVWQSLGDLFGQLVNTDGTLAGVKFPISTAGNQSPPSLTFNPTANEFLLVWQDNRNLAITGLDLFAQRLSGDGTLIGQNFSISTAAGDQGVPSVTFNSVANEFLVVWESSGDLFAQRVNADGTLLGAVFPIFVGLGTQRNPSISYSSQTNQFFVVWADNRFNTFDVFAEVINADGTLAGSDFRITDVGSSSGDSPRVTYNLFGDQFLVTWNDSRNGNSDIFGQLVAVGSEFPPSLQVIPSSLDFGSVPVGTLKDLTIGVENTGGGTLTGNATTNAPFSIVGDNSFNLGSGQSTDITVRFSPTTAGIFSDDITISSNAGNDLVSVAAIGFDPVTNPKPPRITNISPLSGVPGDTVSIFGRNFGPIAGGLSVGSSVVSPLTWNDTFIQFLLPDISPRKYTVQLTTSDDLIARGSLRVLPPPPRITRILPASGGPGATVLIDGLNFGDQQGNSTISIAGETPEILSWSKERIALKVPSLEPRRYVLEVTTASGRDASNFRVTPLLLTEHGSCDDSLLGIPLMNPCWVTIPMQTRQNRDGTVNIALQNIRARWYEVTVTGASFSDPNPFLIGPNQTLTLNNVTLGPDGKISFFADGDSDRAIEMHIWDFLYIMITGKRMPASRTDQISSYVFGLCDIISDICSFAVELGDAIGNCTFTDIFSSCSFTEIVRVLTRLPIVLASNEATAQTFFQTFKFSASQIALIERWSTTLALLELAYHVISVQQQQVDYLTAPSFATSCLLTPSNTGTC